MRRTLELIASFIYRARWRILVVLSPALITVILLLLESGMPITSFVPAAKNDEIFIYKMVSSLLSDGMPLGYFGYNGTHALHGTFGAWSIAALLPYAAFGWLFGWHPYSPLLANLTFLCGANLLFLVLARPKNRELKYLLLVNLLNFSMTINSITAMNECNRTAIGIVLCGAFCRVMQGPTKRFFRFLVLPMLLFGAIQVFLPFVILVPLYFWVLFPDKKKWLSLLPSAAACLILVSLYFLLSHFTQAQYFEAAQSDLILEAVKAQGLLKAIPFAIQLLARNLASMDPAHILQVMNDFRGVFVFLFWAMLFAGAYQLVRRGRPANTKEKQTAWVILYLLGGYLLAYCLMYDARLERISRGLFVICAFVLYFCCMQKKKTVVKTFAVLSCVFALTLNLAFIQTAKERFLPEETRNTYERYRAQVEQLVDISKDNKRWDNTFALYLNPTHAVYCMPDNAGFNYISGRHPVIAKSRYALLNKEDWKASTVQSYDKKIRDKSYVPLLENELFILYERADTLTQ